MRETRLPPTPCPRCGHKLDCATHPDSDAEPREGDFTICLKCQEVLRFHLDEAQALRVHKVSEADILEAPLDQLARFQRMLTQVKERERRRNKARAQRKRKRKTRSR
jgi:hypothetical protein